jgi:hypothetical protein
VNSLIHETKIPMMDMKVQVYSKLSKKKFENKIKSPSSMSDGRFHPPKYRGKLQKMEVLYTHSPKMPGPFPNFLKHPKKRLNLFLKKTKKFGKKASPQFVRLRAATHVPLFFNSCLPLFLPPAPIFFTM